MAPNGNFTDHHRVAEQENTKKINEEKYSSSVLTGQVREFPDVA
jgi:hypothetical protein